MRAKTLENPMPPGGTKDDERQGGEDQGQIHYSTTERWRKGKKDPRIGAGPPSTVERKTLHPPAACGKACQWDPRRRDGEAKVSRSGGKGGRDLYTKFRRSKENIRNLTYVCGRPRADQGWTW